jgi:hypothetical protein
MCVCSSCRHCFAALKAARERWCPNTYVTLGTLHPIKLASHSLQDLHTPSESPPSGDQCEIKRHPLNIDTLAGRSGNAARLQCTHTHTISQIQDLFQVHVLRGSSPPARFARPTSWTNCRPRKYLFGMCLCKATLRLLALRRARMMCKAAMIAVLPAVLEHSLNATSQKIVLPAAKRLRRFTFEILANPKLHSVVCTVGAGT